MLCSVFISILLNRRNILLMFALIPSSTLLSIGNNISDLNKKISFYTVSILWMAGLMGLHFIELGVQVSVSISL